MRAADLLVFLLLVGCGAVSVEATRRQGEPAGVLTRDLLGAWWIPIAVMLPPMYSLLAPVPLMALFQVRVRKTVLHRRVFSAAVIGLAYASASWALHLGSDAWSDGGIQVGAGPLLWAGLAILAGLLGSAMNTLLVAVAVRISNPTDSLRSLLWDREDLIVEAGEICTGVLLAIVAGLNPLLALIALVPVILLQRALMHDQLSAAARLDAKTGLLNASTWEREAASEIARARRTGTPLVVMLADLDHFKQVNDRHGHLVGDEMIKAVADVMRSQLREYDRCSRFGGDEFAVLLPQSQLHEALHTAERIRRRVAGLAIPAGPTMVQTTMSIGVAPLTSANQDVTDLLAAADASLYRTKAEGRDRVRASTDS
jgi:diguanylate cyclase (GGDEF)-like protein